MKNTLLLLSACILYQACGSDNQSSGNDAGAAPDAEIVFDGEDASLPDVGYTSRCAPTDPVVGAREAEILADGKAVVWMDDAFINTYPGHLLSDDPYDAYLAGPDRWKMELFGRLGCEFETLPGSYVLQIRRRATDEVFLTTTVEIPAAVVSILAAYGGNGSPGALVVPAAAFEPPPEETWRVIIANLAHNDIDDTVDIFAQQACQSSTGCQADPAAATRIAQGVNFGEYRTFELPMWSQWYWILPSGTVPAAAGMKPIRLGCAVDNTRAGFAIFCDSTIHEDGVCAGQPLYLSAFGIPCGKPISGWE